MVHLRSPLELWPVISFAIDSVWGEVGLWPYQRDCVEESRILAWGSCRIFAWGSWWRFWFLYYLPIYSDHNRLFSCLRSGNPFVLHDDAIVEATERKALECWDAGCSGGSEGGSFPKEAFYHTHITHASCNTIIMHVFQQAWAACLTPKWPDISMSLKQNSH